MSNSRNIILVGFMGTGKTTVGQMLAARLGKSFVDMDKLIEERTSKSISAIFEHDGEAHFRELERKMAHELSLKDNIVVGAGGGIVLNPANIEAFNESGIVVCLTAAPEVIIERVSSDSHRPLLEDGEKRDQVLARWAWLSVFQSITGEPPLRAGQIHDPILQRKILND